MGGLARSRLQQDGARRNLVIVTPADRAKRGRKFAPTGASRASQAEHLKRLRAINFYPGPPFTSADNLAVQVLTCGPRRRLVAGDGEDDDVGGGVATKPRNLPLLSLGDLFEGREKALEDLRAALVSAKGGVVRALHGLGGVGKTRLAIEYAWAREADYSALLFVRADDAAGLNANLAALAGAGVLDLPEKEAREDEAKIAAVLRWLGANPTWLMILDNVDDREAVAAVAAHAAAQGRPCDRHRARGELSRRHPQARTRRARRGRRDPIPDRTHGRRSQRAKDDEAQARTLARELGGLALGLEQAGAHIATDRIGFARYLKLWNENREKALGWSDPTLTGSEKTLGDDLGDIGCAAFARKPPAARPACDARAGPDPRLAPRHAGPRRGGGL